MGPHARQDGLLVLPVLVGLCLGAVLCGVVVDPLDPRAPRLAVLVVVDPDAEREGLGLEVAAVLKIFTGPAREYFDALETRDYGWLTWATVGADGKTALPAGQYTIGVRMLGTPAGRVHTATVTLAGTRCRQATIKLPANVSYTLVRTGPSPAAPAIGRAGGYSAVSVLAETVYWARVQVEDIRDGRLVEGYVPKTAIEYVP